MEDYSILTLDLLIDKLNSLRSTYQCGSYIMKYVNSDKSLENFTADNFCLDPKTKEFIIDTKNY